MSQSMNETVRAGLDTLSDGHRRRQAQAPRLAAPRDRAAHARRRHRADRALAERPPPGSARPLFTGTALILFTVSAIYHTGTWSPRTWAFLRRFDHANIFLLIAGSYTAFSLLLLDGTTRWVLLATVWSGADPRRAVPDLLDRRPALALRAALHRDGLGGGLLPARRSSTAPPASGSASASRRSR